MAPAVIWEQTSMKKMVYFFANGNAEGNSKMKELLGGKGANLAEMTNIALPVPPGFTITTEVCDEYYKSGRKFPAGLSQQIDKNLAKLERVMKAKLGDNDNPLLVSVRSGAAVSMPGMMDTVLNLGLTDKSMVGLAKQTNERTAWDAYRRLINMFGDVVMGMDHEHFENAMTAVKKKARVKLDTDLKVSHLKELVKKYKAIYRKHTGENFPQNPKMQLRKAVEAVFGSWHTPRAVKYRQINNITGLLGTAVNVQAMVFGNMG
ncbi:MAG: pyruvate, phosphate dikinase, partial [Phycisphaerae bacterium]|nr:pyruvate, phosphate dikinase [Phycisphaerae bacterium]